MKKLLLFILVLSLVLVPALASCSQETPSESQESTEQSDEVSDDGTVKFPLEAQNFGDITLTILCKTNRANQQFVPDEEYEGSVINEAVKARNDFIEENYGIIIETENTSTPASDIRTYIQSNMDTYDLVCDSVCNMLPTVTENFFFSLNDWIDLDQPWWDQQANEYLTLSDKIFFVTGDALITDDLYTSCVLFNKAEYSKTFESTYGSLYDLVREGKWTYDLLDEMAKAYSQPDASGNWTNTDCYYGIVTDGYTGASQLVSGAGVRTVAKDSNGTLVTHVGDESSINAFAKVYEMLNNTAETLYVEQLTSSETKWKDIANMFTTNRALFYVSYVSTLLSIKESEVADKVEPGILPIPKYSEEQDEYYDGINIYQCEVLGIPVTNIAHQEATIYLLEALGYYSSNYSQFGENSVIYATYDTTLKLQSVTADDDSEMMDYILSHRLYDLGGIFNWGGSLTGVYSYCLYSGSNNLVSKWDGMKESVEYAIQETVDAYQNSIA